MLITLIQAACATNCTMTPREEKVLLAMTYNDFDQTENGWRRYAKLACYHESGLLIDKYIKESKTQLQDWQLIGVIWHAGQMYAFNNEYNTAKIRFLHSINPNEPQNTPILWNDYVYATLAFLNNDITKLTFYRNKIANGPIFRGKKVNLNVVENFIKYFRKPYSMAYQATF